jgi:hypothetical protein
VRNAAGKCVDGVVGPAAVCASQQVCVGLGLLWTAERVCRVCMGVDCNSVGGLYGTQLRRVTLLSFAPRQQDVEGSSGDRHHLLHNSMNNSLRIWDLRPFAPAKQVCVLLLSRGHQQLWAVSN